VKSYTVEPRFYTACLRCIRPQVMSREPVIRGASALELIDWAEQEFARAGILCAQGTASDRDEAAAIVYHVLRLDHNDPLALATHADPQAEGVCRDLVRRRIAERIPSAYLLGEAWFAGLPFTVDQRVLLPRSPFAELVLERFEPWFSAGNVSRILEIGTGSGCIAVALALAFPGAELIATDISADALDVARMNAARHGVLDRITLHRGDLYEGIDGRFDLIVSNPPYVPEGDLVGMPREFAWEPRLALVAGADGLDFVRQIVLGARPRLAQGGWLAIEVGGGARALEAAFPGVPFLWPELADGADGIALVAVDDLPRHNAPAGRPESG